MKKIIYLIYKCIKMFLSASIKFSCINIQDRLKFHYFKFYSSDIHTHIKKIKGIKNFVLL